MRLIDGDALKKSLANEFERFLDIHKVIDEQPTAYDVEKVVEEIEMCEHVSLEGFPMIDMNDAIEIVERGGIDEG